MHCPSREHCERGFTIIELMISLVIAMVLMGFIISSFISMNKTSQSQSSRIQRAEDVRLASQIMERELRMAVAASGINLTATTITYTPLDIYSGVCPGGGAREVGVFQYGNDQDRTIAPRNAIWWKRPGNCNYDELFRSLSETNGMQTAANGSGATITLTANYKNQTREDRPMSITFDALPRN